MMRLNKSYRRNKLNGWNRETRCPLSFVHDIDALYRQDLNVIEEIKGPDNSTCQALMYVRF